MARNTLYNNSTHGASKKPSNGLAGKGYNVMLTRIPQDRQSDAQTSLGVGPQGGTAGLPNWMIC